MTLPDRPLALSTAALFTTCAATEIASAALGGFWQHLDPLVSAVGLPEAAVWLLAAGCLVMRPSWGWVLPVVAVVLAFAHGAILMVAGNPLGSLLFPAAGAVGVLAIRHLVVPYRGAAPWFAVGRDATSAQRRPVALPAMAPVSTRA